MVIVSKHSYCQEITKYIAYKYDNHRYSSPTKIGIKHYVQRLSMTKSFYLW